MDERSQMVTRILRQESGDCEELLPLVYDELHAIARHRMFGERAGHTLQATVLVHEAYLKLVGQEQISWRNRKHFYGAAAEAMRRLLIDHARKAKSLKRGGAENFVTLGAPDAKFELAADQVLALNDALEILENEEPDAAEVTRLRFFSGLSVQEVGQVLEMSERSVHRKWTYARARLMELMDEGGE